MLLKKIEIKNFRQFKGDHVIEFSTDADRNITLVVALNTFGKSTILNAINFALYGYVQADFDNAEQLLNSYSAQEKGESWFSVRLDFEYTGRHYSIERKRDVLYMGGGGSRNQDSVSLFEIDRYGNWTENQNFQALINRAIPPQMAQNFIFHGEKRVSLFQTGLTGGAVGRAIREVLGCNIVEAAISDLGSISRDVERSIASSSGQAELQDLSESLERDRELATENRNKISEKEDKIALWEARVQEINKALFDHENTQEIQRRILECERDLIRYESDRKELVSKRLDWFKANASIAISGPLAIEALDILDDEELKGNIPEPYNKEFIHTLLERNTCICGTSLDDNSHAREYVKKCLKQGGEKRIIDARSKTKAFAEYLNASISSARSILVSFESNLREVDQRIGQAEALRSELNERIKDVALDSLNKMAVERDQLNRSIKDELERIGNIKRKIEVEIGPRIKDKSDLIEKATRNLPQLRKLNFMKDFTDRLEAFLQDELQKYQVEATTKVLELTNQSLKSMHRNKEAFFDDKMNLGLRDSKTKSLQGKSTGESQLLVLAFTSALISFCASRENDSSQFLIPGTVAPLVLDAPFGQLDSVFQEAAVSWMPKMARQLILLVSDTQAKILLSDDETKNRINSCYVIQIPAEKQPGKVKKYEIFGRTLPIYNDRGDHSTSVLRVI
jgi:DNA sulfur modification protein DndD